MKLNPETIEVSRCHTNREYPVTLTPETIEISRCHTNQELGVPHETESRNHRGQQVMHQLVTESTPRN